MRSSRFLVASDQALSDGQPDLLRVVLHTGSSQVYLLPEPTLELLLTDPAALSEAERAALSDAELLVADDRDEFAETVADNIAHIEEHRNVRNFVLMPAAYCNMGCGYCGQEHFKLPRSSQHRDAVSRRLLAAVGSPQITDIAVSWFGAEPMMGYDQILDISSTVIPACEQADVRYSSKMVTNGSLLTLDKIRRLHLHAKVGSFEITLDGPPHRHNAQRPLKSGRASFDRITSVMKAACDDAEMPDLRFTVRTNISRANQDEYHEFGAAMAAAGLANSKVTYYTAMVREWGNDVSAYAVPVSDLARVESNWLDAYAEFGLSTVVLPIARNHMVCVTVNPRAEVIAPTGEIYSCTEQPLVPGRQGSHLSHVTTLPAPSLRPTGALDDWNQSLLGQTNAYCPNCSIFPVCGGQCPLVWREGSPACPSLKTTMPMRLTRYGVFLGLAPVPASAAG